MEHKTTLDELKAGDVFNWDYNSTYYICNNNNDQNLILRYTNLNTGKILLIDYGNVKDKTKNVTIVRFAVNNSNGQLYRFWFRADSKLKAIKAVKELTGLGLKEAKDLVDSSDKNSSHQRISNSIKTLPAGTITNSYEVKYFDLTFESICLQMPIEVFNNIYFLDDIELEKI